MLQWFQNAKSVFLAVIAGLRWLNNVSGVYLIQVSLLLIGQQVLVYFLQVSTLASHWLEDCANFTLAACCYTLLQSSLLLLANSVGASVYATARIHWFSCYFWRKCSCCRYCCDSRPCAAVSAVVVSLLLMASLLLLSSMHAVSWYSCDFGHSCSCCCLQNCCYKQTRCFQHTGSYWRQCCCYIHAIASFLLLLAFQFVAALMLITSLLS